MTLFSISGYVRFYRSLPHFFRNMNINDASELTYMLYTANLYSCKSRRPKVCLPELEKEVFIHRLTNWQRKPYRTIVQLYCALEALVFNINWKKITIEQLKVCHDIWSLMDDIENRFRKAFYMEIDNKRTVYRACKKSLSPYKNEPGVCLLQDWIISES